jgi:hypothetical protein
MAEAMGAEQGARASDRREALAAVRASDTAAREAMLRLREAQEKLAASEALVARQAASLGQLAEAELAASAELRDALGGRMSLESAFEVMQRQHKQERQELRAKLAAAREEADRVVRDARQLSAERGAALRQAEDLLKQAKRETAQHAAHSFRAQVAIKQLKAALAAQQAARPKSAAGSSQGSKSPRHGVFSARSSSRSSRSGSNASLGWRSDGSMQALVLDAHAPSPPPGRPAPGAHACRPVGPPSPLPLRIPL